jgi:hypothetical protein
MNPAHVLRALPAIFLSLLSAFAGDAGVHGLWVWKTASVLEAPGSTEALRSFCQSQGINEVYVSISGKGGAGEEGQIGGAIDLLHQSGIRVEALFGNANADEPGKPREALLGHVRGIVEFNRKHPAHRFDGIHLDIEPHQREENKGAGNLKFLPNLAETFRAVRAVAEADRMTVNADIAVKVLKGSADERRMLLASVPRVTLMLYELSSPHDGQGNAVKIAKLRKASDKYLAMAYEGLSDPNLARMSIALRTADYEESLPDMLRTLDEAHRKNPHCLGWARHSYNDHLQKGK